MTPAHLLDQYTNHYCCTTGANGLAVSPTWQSAPTDFRSNLSLGLQEQQQRRLHAIPMNERPLLTGVNGDISR